MIELKTQNKAGDRRKETKGDPNLPQRRGAEMREGEIFTSPNHDMMSTPLLLLKRRPYSRKYIMLD